LVGEVDSNYKCGVCGKTVEIDSAVMGMQCRECGARVFYKKRPSMKKSIKAR